VMVMVTVTGFGSDDGHGGGASDGYDNDQQ
jgi:hypothetical protein